MSTQNLTKHQPISRRFPAIGLYLSLIVLISGCYANARENDKVTPPAAPAAVQAPLPPPDRLRQGSVRALQARLGSLGFYSGPVDGVWGAGTETAVQNFQRARGLQPDGLLGPGTVTALGLTPDALAYR